MRSLAEMLRRAAGEVPQKVIVARSGLGSDQISKIFSGETKDPRWSTMVLLLRDGLGVSLDEFEGGTLKPTLTPYDTTPEYRDLIDLLERVPRRERERTIEAIRWMIEPRAAMTAHEVAAPSVHPRGLRAKSNPGDQELNIGTPPRKTS